jgi:hypothetical protein
VVGERRDGCGREDVAVKVAHLGSQTTLTSQATQPVVGRLTSSTSALQRPLA